MGLGLQGKTVIVTGASRGIGYATAEVLLKEGVKVAICPRHEGELKEVAQALSGLGEVYYEAFDVSPAAENYAFAEHVHDHFGSLDAQVNNVGATGYRKGEEHDGEEIDFMTGVCLKSVIYGCQAVLRYMKEQKKGAIVNVSPLAACCPSVGRSTPYGLLKSAVNNLTSVSAGEYCIHNMRVTCIMPGFTVTLLVKKAISQKELDRNVSSTLPHRMTEPGEVAKPTVSPASGAASYMTAATVEVSGGRGMTPDPTYAYDGLEAKQKVKQKAKEKGGYLR